MFVRGDISNLIADIHVPVNSGDLTRRRATATDVQQHLRLAQRVLFVVCVVIESLELRAKELFGPMTLFASLRRRTEIVNRGRYRARKFVETYGI